MCGANSGKVSLKGGFEHEAGGLTVVGFVCKYYRKLGKPVS